MHPADACPRASEHTPAPAGYVAWHTWAEGMSRLGYRSTRHDAPNGCGLWTQWVTRTGRPARVSVERALKAGRRGL